MKMAMSKVGVLIYTYVLPAIAIQKVSRDARLHFARQDEAITYRLTSDDEPYWNLGGIELINAGAYVPIAEGTLLTSSSRFDPSKLIQDWSDGSPSDPNWSPDSEKQQPPYWIEWQAGYATAIRIYQTGHEHEMATLTRSDQTQAIELNLNRQKGQWMEFSISQASNATDATNTTSVSGASNASNATTTEAENSIASNAFNTIEDRTCPSFYPICNDDLDCTIPGATDAWNKAKTKAPTVDTPPGEDYGYIDGHDNAGTDCQGNFKEYGLNYLAKDDTVPSWYGLKCENWCNYQWTKERCEFSPCSGCLQTGDGEPACSIPKYVSGKKNVLLLMIDDLTVDPGTQKYGHPQSHTPNIEKLADSGSRFEFAYTVHPLCMPSRAAFLTGIYGINSFNMFRDKYYENPLLSKSRTFVEMFKLNGYYTVGTGKIGDYEKPDMFQLWGHDPNYGPFWREKGSLVAHPTIKEPLASSYGFIDGSFGRLSEAKDYITDMNGTDLSKSGWTYGIKTCTTDKQRPMRYVSDDDRDPTPDEMNADFAIEQLANNSLMQHASWFMAVGFIRPHTPMHAPDKYFDHFPLEDIKVEDSSIQGNSDDGHFISERGGDMYDKLVESYGHDQGLKLITQAYLACTYAVDDQIGRVLTALDESPFSSKTIVVLLSDHGWTTGYKQVLWKNTPWEPSTRIPLIIKDPDYTPNRVKFPVSSIDVYPTLMDLAGLEITNTLIGDDGHVPDGYTLTHFMKDASFDSFAREGAISIISENEDEYIGDTSKLQWNPKVFTMTVRMKDYRYIMVSNGTEELYYNVKDPYEMTNLLHNADMKNSSTQEMKHRAMQVLNSELAELGFGTLDAELDPKICLSTLWMNC